MSHTSIVIALCEFSKHINTIQMKNIIVLYLVHITYYHNFNEKFVLLRCYELLELCLSVIFLN